MKMIVSANYLDRNSPYPFLIRKEGAPLESARPCKAVIAEGVSIEDSSQDEEGFGCSVVAKCDQAIGLYYQDQEERNNSFSRPMEWTGTGFMDSHTERSLKGMGQDFFGSSRTSFYSDGQFFGTPPTLSEARSYLPNLSFREKSPEVLLAADTLSSQKEPEGEEIKDEALAVS